MPQAGMGESALLVSEEENILDRRGYLTRESVGKNKKIKLDFLSLIA